MISFHWEIIDSKLKQLHGIFAEEHISIFFILPICWYLKKTGKYSRHSMLDFRLFCAFSSVYYCLSMNNKQPSFYFISLCFSQQYNSLIQILKSGRNSQHSMLDFHSEKIIKKYARGISVNYSRSLVILQIFWFVKQTGKYRIHYMLSFPLLLVITSTDYFLSMKDTYTSFYVSSSCLVTTFQFTIINE